MSLPSEQIIDQMITPIKNGEVAIFATDTVLGIGCAIKRPDLIKRICQLKKRPVSQPIALLVSSVSAVEKLTGNKLSQDCQILANRCWPGALTMLVAVSEEVRQNDTEWWSLVAPQGFIGVRSPNNQDLLAAIESLGGAIMATSANLHNEPVPNSIVDLPAEITSAVNNIWFPDNVTFSGQASTVVKTTPSGFELLREGFFSAKQLKEFIACDKSSLTFANG